MLDISKVHVERAERNGKPLAWTIDAGDRSGVFALVSSLQPLAEPELTQLLSLDGAADDPSTAEALCARAQAAGMRCDASWVEVKR